MNEQEILDTIQEAIDGLEAIYDPNGLPPLHTKLVAARDSLETVFGLTAQRKS